MNIHKVATEISFLTSTHPSVTQFSSKGYEGVAHGSLGTDFPLHGLLHARIIPINNRVQPRTILQ